MNLINIFSTRCGLWFQRVEDIIEDSTDQLDSHMDVETYASVEPMKNQEVDQILLNPSRPLIPVPVPRKRKGDDMSAYENMSMFKRVRLMHRVYQERNHTSKGKNILNSSIASLEKSQRIF